jgi:hypothetical protein
MAAKYMRVENGKPFHIADRITLNKAVDGEPNQEYGPFITPIVIRNQLNGPIMLSRRNFHIYPAMAPGMAQGRIINPLASDLNLRFRLSSRAVYKPIRN